MHSRDLIELTHRKKSKSVSCIISYITKSFSKGGRRYTESMVIQLENMLKLPIQRSVEFSAVNYVSCIPKSTIRVFTTLHLKLSTKWSLGVVFLSFRCKFISWNGTNYFHFFPRTFSFLKYFNSTNVQYLIKETISIFCYDVRDK